jgi:hypothetical protein
MAIKSRYGIQRTRYPRKKRYFCHTVSLAFFSQKVVYPYTTFLLPLFMNTQQFLENISKIHDIFNTHEQHYNALSNGINEE